LTIITIPSEYLPLRTLLNQKYPDLELPDHYEGTSNNIYAAEIFYNSVQEGRNWENIVLSYQETKHANPEELINAALCAFYAPRSNFTIFQGFAHLADEKELSPNSALNCAYLAHHFGQSHTIIIFSTLAVLKNSPIIQLKMNETVPSYEEIHNNIEVIKWMKHENITAPTDVTWFVSQHWSPDILVSTLVDGGSMREITRLLAVGFRDPEEIKRQITGEDVRMPDSWLADLMDIVGYEDSI
jgi:hypothetical protein